MTWSIIAKDHETGLFGIVVATRDLAVGAICPWAEGRVGAICSQALPNPTWRQRGLELLRRDSRRKRPATCSCDLTKVPTTASFT